MSTSYRIQVRQPGRMWDSRHQPYTQAKNGEALILRRLGDVVSTLPASHEARAVVLGVDGDYGNPVEIIATVSGQRIAVTPAPNDKIGA